MYYYYLLLVILINILHVFGELLDSVYLKIHYYKSHISFIIQFITFKSLILFFVNYFVYQKRELKRIKENLENYLQAKRLDLKFFIIHYKICVVT